jgi:hypothetical protein
MDDEYSIEEYEEWVMKDFPVNNDWEPELFYIAGERDLIHKAVVEGQVGDAEMQSGKTSLCILVCRRCLYIGKE